MSEIRASERAMPRDTGALKIIEHNQDFVVVDKPAGIPVHNDPNNLVELLELRFGERLKPVHRLDRETSGVILFARGSEAAARLQSRLQHPESSKTYLAVVRGVPPELSGVWSAPLTPRAEGRKNPAGKRAERVDAQTRFEVIAQSSWLSLVRCQLITGRQHQIRKHATLAGCHLVGDTRYGDPKHAKMIAKRYRYNGIALHAAHLTLYTPNHPPLQFKADPPSAWSAWGLEAH